jgi:hypothetical protein
LVQEKGSGNECRSLFLSEGRYLCCEASKRAAYITFAQPLERAVA